MNTELSTIIVFVSGVAQAVGIFSGQFVSGKLGFTITYMMWGVLSFVWTLIYLGMCRLNQNF